MHVFRSRSPSVLVLGAALALLGGTSARASVVVAMSVGELAEAAERVFVGEVVGVESAWDSGGKRIVTRVKVNVADLWKGPAPASGLVEFAQLGGRVGNIEMRVHGLSTFEPGERAVLFLRGTQEGTGGGVVGLGQGKRPLRFDSATQRWMVGGGDRSALVVGAGGRPFRAPERKAVALEEFKRQVLEHVAR